jgi:hypothetical protein
VWVGGGGRRLRHQAQSGAQSSRQQSTYWSDKERRNRYIHDDWYVALTEDSAIPATRGLPLKKGSDVVWDEPTPNEVWKLAHRFVEYKSLFSHAAYEIQRRKTTDASDDDDH